MPSEGALTMAKKSTQPRRRSTRQAAPDSQPAPAPAMKDPTFEEIAEAAYQRYLQRGGGPGQDFDDWLEAERALKRR